MNLIIGSHVSFNSKKQLLGSVEEALSYNANTFMIYTGGAQSTIRSNINDEYTYEAFKLMIENNINPKNVIVHAPYIVNLANKSDERKYEFYIEFLINELNRVKELGLDKIVLHPGSATTCTKEEAISNITEGINKIYEKTTDVMILLEYMAGKGNEIGRSFEEIRDIIDKINFPDKIGVCLDTCHLNDAGYDIGNFDNVLDLFDNIVGIDKIYCVHINDSMNVINSHKDRHANIGFGTIGFDNLLNVIYNKRLSDIPMILETPYVTKDDNSKEKIYPPYKYEIEMIRNKKFDSEMINKIREG